MNWKVLGVNDNRNYYVIRQANAENKFTDNIKIVKKSCASVHGIVNISVEAKADSYSYYVKRRDKYEV